LATRKEGESLINNEPGFAHGVAGDLYQLEHLNECLGFNIVGAYRQMLNRLNEIHNTTHSYAFDPCAVDTHFAKTLAKVHNKLNLL
jgi:hypothetical protein